MTTTYQEYLEDKQAFFRKHKFNYTIYTSPMDKDGNYYKTYSFADNATWCESMAPAYDTIQVEVKRVSMNVHVKLLRTEYWSSEAPSKFYYEKY